MMDDGPAQPGEAAVADAAAAAALPYRAGVGIMLLNAAAKVWIGRRRTAPNAPPPVDPLRLWQMPQGGIDQGETPVAAAWRELLEETGTDRARLLGESAGWLTYDLPPYALQAAFGGRFRGQRQKWFALHFLGTDADFNIDEPVPGVAAEFDAWRWANLDELPQLVVPFKQRYYMTVIDEMRRFVPSVGA